MTRTTTRIRNVPVITALTILSLVLTAAGCRSEPRTAGAVMSDSAGVRIIDNTDYAWPQGQGWRLAAEPAVDIGVLEGDAAYQLFRVRGSKRLSDGRIVVANAGSLELRFYDPGGSHLFSVGREGGGPGEFGSILTLQATTRDSLLVFDQRNQRLSVFAADGSLARTAQFQFLPEIEGLPVIVAPFSDGSLLVGVRTYFGSGEIRSGLSRDNIIYVHCSADGQLIDTLAILPGGELNTIAEDNTVMVGDRPFGRYPRHAIHADGFYYGSSDRYQIDDYGQDGGLRRSLRRALANMEVTAADVDSYMREQIEAATDDRRREIAERLLANVSFPETFPAHGDIHVDSDGNLWVAVYRRPDDDQPRWTVFDPNGQMLGVVSTPPRFTIYQIGSDFVLGRWLDELDVEHVRLFELLKD
jgi:hypothetical protein